MPDTWDSETKERRNERVALEVMGWFKGKRRIADDVVATPCWFKRNNQQHFPIHEMQCTCAGYRPTEDIGWAWKVQARITELGLTSDWGFELGYLVGLLDGDETRPLRDVVARAATASADERCHAAVLAVKGMGKETPDA